MQIKYVILFAIYKMYIAYKITHKAGRLFNKNSISIKSNLKQITKMKLK